MKPTERINRINDNLNHHFKSNSNGWWVSNSYSDKQIIELHHGIGGERIKPIWVAAYILKTEPTVKIVHWGMGCTMWTRESIKGAGLCTR